MAGISIPRDRTTKQKPRGFCTNPECLESSDQQRFEFDVDNDKFSCPKCGGCMAPMVGLLACVHLQVRDKAGPIVGYGGLRYRLACCPTRVHLATVTNEEGATGDLRFVNCPGCLKAAVDEKLPALTGFAINQQT